MPLPVRLVGRYLKETGETAGEYLEWLEKSPLEALDRERKLESVPLLIRCSMDQVSESAKCALAVAGALALSSFSRESMADAMPGTQVRKPLNELVSYGLLQRKDPFLQT